MAQSRRGETAQESQRFRTLRVSVDRGVTSIMLDRPARRNALSSELLSELREVVAAVASDPGVGVVISGSPGMFSAGADITELADARSRPDSGARGELIGRSAKLVLEAIERVPVPVIACVDGYALGGGLELALACDVVYATGAARFAFPEAELGLLPGFGGTRRIIERVGYAASAELVLLGGSLSAEDAERRGLVARVFDDAESMHQHVSALLCDGRPRSSPAISLAKEALAAARSGTREEAFGRESMLYGRAFELPDSGIGIEAFLSKHSPSFISIKS